jgi:hypothetical protein
LFIHEFDLVEEKEMAPLQSIIDKIHNSLKEKEKEDQKATKEDEDA